MESIVDKARSAIKKILTRNRTLFSHLYNLSGKTILRPSQKKLRLQYRKDYFKKRSLRRPDSQLNNGKRNKLTALTKYRPTLTERLISVVSSKKIKSTVLKEKLNTLYIRSKTKAIDIKKWLISSTAVKKLKFANLREWSIEKVSRIKLVITKEKLNTLYIRSKTKAIALKKYLIPSVALKKFKSIELKKRVNTLFSTLKMNFDFSKLGKNRYPVVALIAVLCVLGVSGLAVANSTEKAVVVKVDDKKIAAVSSQAEAEKVLEQIKQQKTEEWKRKITFTEKVSFNETEIKKYQIDSLDDLKEKLNNSLTFVGVATGIKADGRLITVVEDKDVAEKLLDNLKKRFAVNLESVKIESVKFKENIEIEEIPATLKEIEDIDSASDKIINGKEKAKVHTVKEGESLWTIARKYDTHVADLKLANPEIKGEKLDIGQELKLVKVEPLITVEVTAKTTVEEKIAYDVKVEKSNKLWKGQQKIKEKGENGSREVTYKLVLANGVEVGRDVLEEKILKPAKDQVVIRGSKLVVASRGGNGQLAWPIRGKLTSPFGTRWGRMHTGIDIDGYTGQPIGAAEAGVVVSTGWDGAYGKQVTIDHGNGMKTKYAHMSAINVSVGEKVTRGQLIGKVGNTGRSTGSHLHFEVKIRGSFRNPLSYLK